MSISAPPTSCEGATLSPRSAAASNTVHTGSTVDSTAARVGPTRSSPAKKRTIAATVETIDQTEMLSIAHRDFHALATKNPEILWRVMEVLCERIRGLNEETLNLAFEELPYRIVQALDELVEKRGKPGAGGRIVVETTPADIGQRVGADRQETCRVLKMLSKRGLLELDADEVVIPDARALKRALEYAHEWF